jgi:hypothetical protein
MSNTLPSRQTAEVNYLQYYAQRFFNGFYKDPDSDEEMRKQRLHQWRPISQNPFAEPKGQAGETQDQGSEVNEGNDEKVGGLSVVVYIKLTKL